MKWTIAFFEVLAAMLVLAGLASLAQERLDLSTNCFVLAALDKIVVWELKARQ